MKKLATILAFLIAPIAFSQSLGGGLFGPPSYPRFSTFANLSTPIAGHFRYCTDCTATAPCAGSGTGAFAFRVGSTWNCNDGTGGTGSGTLGQNSKSAAYTTVLSDAGKHIYHPSADVTARIWTIDSNANVAYVVGTTITFVNDCSAGVITIAITSDTLILAGTGATGSRTLAACGIATALKITSTRWIISGSGIS